MIVTLGSDEVPPGKPLAVRVSDALTLAVCERDGAYYAFDNKCPHKGAPLADGQLSGELVICPHHHFKFNVKTGRCMMPRHLRMKTYSVTREGELLKIELPESGSDPDFKGATEPVAVDTAAAETPDPKD